VAGSWLELANDKKQHATHALTFVLQACHHSTISNKNISTAISRHTCSYTKQQSQEASNYYNYNYSTW
jgi:hypothetical protein